MKCVRDDYSLKTAIEAAGGGLRMMKEELSLVRMAKTQRLGGYHVMD